MSGAGHERPVLLLDDLLLLSAILIMPWAFGGVDLWAYRTVSCLLVGAGAAGLAREGWAGLGLERSRRWLLPAGLLALWATIQIVPLPPALIAGASPEADRLYRQTFPDYPGTSTGTVADRVEREALALVPETADVPDPGGDEPFEAAFAGRWTGWRTLSLHPLATLERLLWYLALLVGFLAIVRRTEDRARARRYRELLFVDILLLSVIGLIYAALPNGKLLWVRDILEVPVRPFGPYVNPTNFAGVMEMFVPWILGYLLLRVRRRGRGALVQGSTPLLVAAAVLGVVSGVATASKSATVILVVEVAVLLLLAARGLRRKLAVVGLVALLVGAAVPLLFRTTLGERVEHFVGATGGELGEVNRLVAWRSGWRMFVDFPATGVGFGSFRDAFPHYMQAGETHRWSQVHNDYLELLIDGGIPAAVLVVWLAFGFWRRVAAARALRGAEGPDLEQAGMVLGLLALSLHAVYDFNHQIPANALLFVTLGAMAWTRTLRKAPS